jgi:HD-GYP domain-containing protein (c-di-GMP phosphodiesterase class II)
MYPSQRITEEYQEESMQLRMDQLIKTIGTALDIVEGELLGASTNHGKRIAVLCTAMGRHLNMSEEEVLALSAGAILHDNALTEYILAEREGKKHDPAMKLHCELGQRNLESLGFGEIVRDMLLYHHEKADGSGPFGKKEGEFPLSAEIISIADYLDVFYHFQQAAVYDLPVLRADISVQKGKLFTGRAAEALRAVLDDRMLFSLRDDRIEETADKLLPPWTVDMEDEVIKNFAEFIIRIIDYKSRFTKEHSLGIAEKAWYLGGYYGYDNTARTHFYLAAALHDLGKLAIPVDILEKQGKLTDHEFRIIAKHVYHTWRLLKDIRGFEQICTWASSHHEKLDGTGYSFGKKAGGLDFNSRLLACIDIYQGVSEPRPYHPARNHRDTMAVLYDMAAKGLIDEGIVRDLDKILPGFTPRTSRTGEERG